jgi:hypothetical protein
MNKRKVRIFIYLVFIIFLAVILFVKRNEIFLVKKLIVVDISPSRYIELFDEDIYLKVKHIMSFKDEKNKHYEVSEFTYDSIGIIIYSFDFKKENLVITFDNNVEGVSSFRWYQNIVDYETIFQFALTNKNFPKDIIIGVSNLRKEDVLIKNDTIFHFMNQLDKISLVSKDDFLDIKIKEDPLRISSVYNSLTLYKKDEIVYTIYCNGMNGYVLKQRDIKQLFKFF